MGLFDFFRRSESEDDDAAEEDLVGFTPETSCPPTENPPGAGGPFVLATELSRLRFIANNEAVNTARSEPDPSNWQDGQMQFEVERATAHDHEGLRDQLSNYVAARLAVEASEVYSAATDVGLARERLRTVDEALVPTTIDWRRKYRLATFDPMEIGRYYRERSNAYRAMKIVIVAILVLVELVLTAAVFNSVFRSIEIPFLPVGYLLAGGVIVLLIVVPHFAALGLKEGLSSHHSFSRSDYDNRGLRAPVELRQMEHREIQDDRVFRWTSALMGVFLVGVILSISWLRAAHVDSEVAPVWVWFVLFLFIQTSISAYFFFREWLDYGSFAKDLVHVSEKREELEEQREDAVGEVAAAAETFHHRAEDLLFTLQEAPRWDNYIVQSYLGTIHYVRHIVGIENPDIRAFLAGAVIPYLGPRSEAADSTYPLEALSLENVSLESYRPVGRRWRIQRVGEEGVADFEHSDSEDDTDEQVAWMITKTPTEMLEEYLDRYFDLPAKYDRPPELEPILTDEDWLLGQAPGRDRLDPDELESGEPTANEPEALGEDAETETTPPAPEDETEEPATVVPIEGGATAPEDSTPPDAPTPLDEPEAPAQNQ